MREIKRSRSGGQIAILTGLVLLVLVGVTGLALDSGLGYMLRARLNSALDAAAIAAARSVVVSEAAAVKSANDFFAANYPTDLWGSTPTLDSVVVTPDQGRWIIDVAATATVPVNVMGVFGFNLLTVKSVAQVVRKDLDLAFVMDTTDSMAPVAANVKSSAKSFLDHFSATTDRFALIHFAHGAVVDVPFKADFSRGFDRATMKARIDAFGFNGFTNYSEGFWNARDQLNRIPVAKRSSLRVIVFFSDGSPNTFASHFQFRSSPSCVTSPETFVAGALQTAANATGEPDGLWRYDVQNQPLAGTCYRGTSIVGCTTGTCLTAAAIPAWYNPHDRLGEMEFAVVTGSPRVVTNSTASEAIAYRNVNRASRNLPEAMAAKSRDEGIYVYTLGLGSHVQDLTGPDNEDGESLLKCMANTPDSLARCYKADKPKGDYCWAKTDNDLKACYDRLASEIMKITK